MVHYLPALRAFARSLTRDANDADDLVQETLTKALANIDRFEPGTRMKSWLFTIMRNTFLTAIKVRKREAPGVAEAVSDSRASEATQEWALRGREVRDGLSTLPQTQREALVLIGMLGISYEEAADICECPVGTIKSRLNRGRAGLLAYLDETSIEAALDMPRVLPSEGLDVGLSRRR